MPLSIDESPLEKFLLSLRKWLLELHGHAAATGGSTSSNLRVQLHRTVHWQSDAARVLETSNIEGAVLGGIADQKKRGPMPGP